VSFSRGAVATVAPWKSAPVFRHVDRTRRARFGGVAVGWLDAQRSERMSVAARLLRLVRFQLIAPEVLAREVQAVGWLFNNHDCMEPVWQAYKYARSMRDSSS